MEHPNLVYNSYSYGNNTLPVHNHRHEVPAVAQHPNNAYGSLNKSHGNEQRQHTHVKYETYDSYNFEDPEWSYPASTLNGVHNRRQPATGNSTLLHNLRQPPNIGNHNINHNGNNGPLPPQYVPAQHQQQKNFHSASAYGIVGNNLSLNQSQVVRQIQEKFSSETFEQGHPQNLLKEEESGINNRLCCSNLANEDRGSRNDGPAPGGDLSDGGIRESYFRSLWLHCRLPLLLLLVVVLLIIFLSFSGALIYFRYVPKSRSPLAEEEPCEQTYCAFGATCYVENGRSVCRCPEVCSSNYSPVCGNDEITYSNECLLRMYACQNQKSIRIKHSGECDTPNPCADKACLFGSRCVSSRDGQYATCECPASCPNFGDSDESQPVCGSDGRYYRNRCELDRQACSLARNITVKYPGKCDPCEDIICTLPQVCHLDETRRPVCRCSETCSMEFKPVCGSDGKTYSNECVMRQEACRTRRDMRIIYRGKCSSGVNPCESKTCRGYESCAINRFGIAQCACGMVCDPLIQPVCGSDGKTYDNHCQLTLSSCREGKHIAVSYKGTCESGNSCLKHTCQPGATCSEKNGELICECPKCSSEYSPVCGADGVSYQNECRLRLESCITNNHIELKYTGLCNGCNQKQCDFYASCESDLGGTKCVCRENCTSETSETSSSSSLATAVCGTDGTTYDSECELRKEACLQQKFVVVASKGHCDLCANVQCKFGAKCDGGICVCPTECPPNREAVCGSNLLTYSNECELQKAACRLGRTLSVHFYGDCNEGISGSSGTKVKLEPEYAHPTGSSKFGSIISQGFFHPDEPRPKLCDNIRCDYGALCELGEDGFPRCTCQFNCTFTSGNPVCGSDLKLYSGECEMRREACHRQTELRPRPMELCEETELRPCNGEEPVKSAETGEDINCGNGQNRANCPAGSFCHRSRSFAKCCKKLEERSTTRRPMASGGRCSGTTFGCCPDGQTVAFDPNNAGCPSICQCNKLGSVAETCDPVTQDCLCRTGVGGNKCDRCLPGFWGLQRIAIEGETGCMSCGCSKFGSVRDDCEQMSGRCVCKPGVLGHKCDSCGEGEFLGPYGCTSDSVNLGRTCEEVVCGFGAECEQDGNRAGCICNIHCTDIPDKEEVCASDGFTYESECLVRLQSCRSQKPIWVTLKGPCRDSSESDGTESPTIRRWTGSGISGLHFTEPGDDGMDGSESGRSNGEIWRDQMGAGSSGMKSTRHLPLQPKFQDSFLKNFYGHRSPTSATIQIRSYLGESCVNQKDCVTAHSICLSGWCICREGFHEDSERIQCKTIHPHTGPLRCSKDSNLCEFPSDCFDHLNGTHSCVCPLAKSNSENGCSHTEHPFPFFSGRSTISIGKLAGYHKLSLELEVTPYLDYAHGILVFSSQHSNGSGDFLSLALIDGFVEFRYDLGDGPAILRSATRVHAGSTYHIVAKRYNRDGLLRVDEEEDVKGISPGTMKSLNLDHGGYLGYTPLNSTKIWETVGTSEGFIGCVHKLKVGRRPIEFEKKDPLIVSFDNVFQCPVMSPFHRFTTTPMYNVYFEGEGEEEQSASLRRKSTTSTTDQTFLEGPVTGNRCSKSPCQNHGICWEDKGVSSGFKCVCHPEYTGSVCDSRLSAVVETEAMLDFRGFSYLEVPKIDNGARQVSIEMWLMLRAQNGLILYNGQEMGKGDFLTLLVHNGHLQFLFDLGSGMANLTWSLPISLNKWHWVVVKREGREGRLQIDGQPVQLTRSPPTLSELNLELPLYIGGIRDMNMVHRELGILTPFDGALQFMRVNGETYHKEINTALRERLVHRYEGPPCGTSVEAPCLNGGTCFPRLESFVCLCPSQFSGRNCEIRLEIPGPVSFDGQSYLRFPRKVSKNESFNFSDYDDLYNEHFDSHLDELFSDDEILSEESEGENDPVEGSPDEDNAEFENEEYVDNDDFNPILEYESENRVKAQRRNRIEIVFRTKSENPGLLIWTGKGTHVQSNKRKGYLGLFIVDGYPELRVELGAGKHKRPTIIRSKVKVSDDGRWHQILIARRRRLIVLQVDSSTPQRATAPVGSNVLLSDGRYWLGGVATSVLPGEVPPELHQGFVGCIDMVRIEKRRLPLSKIAYATGTPFCEDDD